VRLRLIRQEDPKIMQETSRFRVVAWWSSGRTGLAKSSSAPNALHFAAPPQFGGVEGRWTPEDLLLSAVASCFTTTFRTLADSAKFEYTDMEVEVYGTVGRTNGGYRFEGIVIRPRLETADEDGARRGLDLLMKTHALCLVSRALATAQQFEPKVEVSKMAPVG
jgi:organic hydroperoxide reductase OsmC/OhrA